MLLLGARRWLQQPRLPRQGKDRGGRGGGEEGKRKHIKLHLHNTNFTFYEDSFIDGTTGMVVP